MRSRDEYESLAEALYRDGDVILAALGFERGTDGEWREEDHNRMLDLVEKHGLAWAYEQVEKSGLPFEAE